MPRIAITGHVNVPPDVADWVRTALTSRLVELTAPGWRGITCLARGADQLFAHAVIALNGPFDVVLPAADYMEREIAESDRESFQQLLDQAELVETLPYPNSGRDAYVAASETMLSRCDHVLAVWDGEPSKNRGDTADVVQRAYDRNIPVTVVWPPWRRPVRPARPVRPCAGGQDLRPASARGRD